MTKPQVPTFWSALGSLTKEAGKAAGAVGQLAGALGKLAVTETQIGLLKLQTNARIEEARVEEMIKSLGASVPPPVPITSESFKANKWEPVANNDEQYNALLRTLESEREQFMQERNELLLKYEGYLSEEEAKNILNENYSVRNELEQIYPELEKLRIMSESYFKKRKKVISQRIRHCYPNIDIGQEAYKDIIGLTESRLNAVERQFGLLQHDTSNIKLRDTVTGTRVRELEYNNDGRIYLSIEGNMVTVYRIGNKGTQGEDIKWIRSHCR